MYSSIKIGCLTNNFEIGTVFFDNRLSLKRETEERVNILDLPLDRTFSDLIHTSTFHNPSGTML